MTKEQIQKHGEVMKWYIDNPEKGVWFKQKDSDWRLTITPEFNTYMDWMYIKNDEYSEFRKALVDGNTIQYKPTNYNNMEIWKDILREPSFQLPVEKYRVKPETPKYWKPKKGDWVRIKNSDPVEIAQIKTVKHHSVLLKGFNEETYRFFNSNITLWKPEVDELCVFWTRENNGYNIKKFNYMSEDGAFTTLDKSRYTYAAPLEFIETLKELK